MRNEVVHLEAAVPADGPPEWFDEQQRSLYESLVGRFDAAFAAMPEHKRSVLWVLSRLVAADYVSSRSCQKPVAGVDRRLVSAMLELGKYVRDVDHVEMAKTQMALVFLGELGNAVMEVLESELDQQRVIRAVRSRFLRLAAAADSTGGEV